MPQDNRVVEIERWPECPTLRGHCLRRTYRGVPGQVVVVHTELDDNPGMSITNSAELLVERARWDWGGSTAVLVIEHYRRRALDEWCREESCRHRHWRSGSIPTHKRGVDCPVASSYDLVTEENGRVHWSRLDHTQVLALCGRLPD